MKKEKMIIACAIVSILIIMISSIYFADILPKREVLEPTEIYSSKNMEHSALLKDDANGDIYLSYGKPNANQWFLRKIDGKNLSSEIAINLTKYNLTTGVLPSGAVYNKTLYLLAKGGILVYNLKNQSAKVIKIEDYYVPSVIPYASIKTSSKYIAFALSNNSEGFPQDGYLCPILLYDLHTSRTRLIPTKYVLEFMDISPNGHYLSYVSSDLISKVRENRYIFTINLENNHTSMLNISKINPYRIGLIDGDLSVHNDGKIQFVCSNFTSPKIYYYVEIENGKVVHVVSQNNIFYGLSGEVKIIGDKMYMLFIDKKKGARDIWQASLEVLNRELNLTKKYSFECRGFEAMDGGFANFEISKEQNEIYVELKGDKWAIFAIPI